MKLHKALNRMREMHEAYNHASTEDSKRLAAWRDEVIALRDERDRLRDELDVYRQAVQYVFEAINKFDDIQRKKAALTPAEGGMK